mmetsp:Transcript_87201/g.247245  ORF Transcript_87201/g.247245 Transcript_87201/m.247245 type:complete len:367 (+) Transcript_87201:153-1253(+)
MAMVILAAEVALPAPFMASSPALMAFRVSSGVMTSVSRMRGDRAFSAPLTAWCTACIFSPTSGSSELQAWRSWTSRMPPRRSSSFFCAALMRSSVLASSCFGMPVAVRCFTSSVRCASTSWSFAFWSAPSACLTVAAEGLATLQSSQASTALSISTSAGASFLITSSHMVLATARSLKSCFTVSRGASFWLATLSLSRTLLSSFGASSRMDTVSKRRTVASFAPMKASVSLIAVWAFMAAASVSSTALRASDWSSPACSSRADVMMHFSTRSSAASALSLVSLTRASMAARSFPSSSLFCTAFIALGMASRIFESSAFVVVMADRALSCSGRAASPMTCSRFSSPASARTFGASALSASLRTSALE